MTERFDLWFRRFHRVPGGGCRLVCFPHAGGSASYFFPASQALSFPRELPFPRATSPAVEVLAVQYPGRQDRHAEPGHTSIAALADDVFDLLAPLTDRPLALFGHSMGAIVAFEVARRLERQAGTVPVMLFASGRRAPGIHRAEFLHRGGDEALLAELRSLAGTDPRILGDDEFLRVVLPALRSDYQAIELYRCEPGPKLACPITAMGGGGDPRASIDDLRGWRDHTTGAFDLRVFPGGHFYLADQAASVLDVVRHRLAVVGAGS